AGGELKARFCRESDTDSFDHRTIGRPEDITLHDIGRRIGREKRCEVAGQVANLAGTAIQPFDLNGEGHLWLRCRGGNRCDESGYGGLSEKKRSDSAVLLELRDLREEILDRPRVVHVAWGNQAQARGLSDARHLASRRLGRARVPVNGSRLLRALE